MLKLVQHDGKIQLIMKQKAVIILPTYNERENIAHTIDVLQGIFAKIKDWQMEILVVDDTSPDKTYELVEQIAKKSPNVHLLINKQKNGLGAAYLKGMAEAFGRLQADVVFEFDADLSHDPTKIPEMLRRIDQGADMVLGSRYIAGGGIPSNWGWHRKFLSIVGNWTIMVVLTNFKIRDWTSGYRAITKKVYETVHHTVEGPQFTGYTFQVGFLYNAAKAGFKIEEVAYQFTDRVYGHSKIGPEYLKNTLAYIFSTRFNEIVHHRVFKFAVVGGIGAVVQLTSLALFRNFFPYQLANFFSVEMAVLSNFLINNVWTFKDRKLALRAMPIKFIQFNIASFGSVLIQLIVAFFGETFIGIQPLFVTPVLNVTIDTASVFAITGIFLGMIWNFFAYNRFIWKKAKTK